MAFEAFIPASAPLSGNDAILEGVSYRRTFTVRKLVNGVDTPVNMTEYDDVAPVIVFKNADTQSGGVTTGCPVGVCVWTDAAGGTFRLDCTATETNPGSQVFNGIYEIKVTHDTEFEVGSSGPKKTALVFKDAWAVTKTAVAT